MSNYLAAYVNLLSRCRRGDFRAFLDRHAELSEYARLSGDHRPVTTAYYDMMAPIIGPAFGSSWHFVPPEHPRQSKDDASRSLHRRIASALELAPGRRALDLGCGLGGAVRDFGLQTGADVEGVCLSQQEVDQGNRLCVRAGLAPRCRLRRGELEALPYGDETFDAASAIYSLKYFPHLGGVFGEVQRVLRPGGRLVAYCLLKTDRYDPGNPEHVEIVGGLEYATGMPSLRTGAEMIEQAQESGLHCTQSVDLSGDTTWYHEFVKGRFLPWVAHSTRLRSVYAGLEHGCLLADGFTEFHDTFVLGILRRFIRAGQLGILTGSSLMVFKRG